LARIVAGSPIEGIELRFQRVLDEVLAQPNIMLFDEIHNIGGTGSAEGSWTRKIF
jgi:ATP-dependent Clp protease ATP-binding subunit ClpA